MATVPSSRAVVAFDSTANTFYLTNSSNNATSAFPVADGVTVSLESGNLTVTSGSNGGEQVFEINTEEKWNTTSYDPSRGMVAVLAIGSGMIETRTTISNNASYGRTTNVATYTCKLEACGSLTIKKVGNTLKMYTN